MQSPEAIIASVIRQHLTSGGLELKVEDWHEAEREYYRNGDWTSFTDRMNHIWIMRSESVARAIITELAGRKIALDAEATPSLAVPCQSVCVDRHKMSDATCFKGVCVLPEVE